MFDTKTEQEIIKRAAQMLRMVQQGKSCSSLYFTGVTMATERMADGDEVKAKEYLEYLRLIERHTGSGL